MANYSKYKNVNTVFGGESGIVIPNGSTAQRSPGVVVGTLRYNSDLGLVEQYNALGWQSVDAPPTVTNISGTINENTNSTITITGSNFKTGAIVSIEGAGVGGIPRALSTTFVSTSTVTAASNATAVNYVGGASFSVKVSNPSGLSAALDPAGTIDRDPLWSTASTTYTVFDTGRGSALSFTASDPDGSGTITYSLVTGSLPAGASLNSASGAISGFSAVGSDVSSTFTLRATSSVGSQTADRQFTILVKAPVVTTFSTVGSGTFSVPSGITAVRVLVIGGGGTGGHQVGGGGGAGGFVEAPNYPVTPGGSVPYTVGAGGPAPGFQPSANTSYPGNNSVFGAITALGGGGGGCHNGPGGGIPTGSGPGGPGGSGGGGGAGPAGNSAGSATQGPSGGYTGYGFGGSNGAYGWAGGGGGGAGGAGVGNAAADSRGGDGGPGRNSDITGSTVTYAGGGGGTASNGTPGSGGSGGGARGTNNPESKSSGTFYGGGGGGARDHPTGGGDGFKGVVIVRY